MDTKITFANLTQVVRLLDGSGVPWGIFGGAAAKVFGATRPLQDIDILIPCDSGQRVSQFFPDAHFDFDADGHVASLKLPGYDIIAGLHQNIHFVLDSKMEARTIRHKLLEVDLPVLSIEDNIAFKTALGRGPEVGKHDWEDVAVMLKFTPTIDWDYLRWRLRECAPERAKSLEKRINSLESFD